MQDIILQQSAKSSAPPDPAQEVARLEALLAERRAELVALQEKVREFKMRYTRIVGGRLAELAEVERAIREAESRLLGVEEEEEDEAESPSGAADSKAHVRLSVRSLFWSVAKLFHPDHAPDEREARRRHRIMAEASRAYREGDVESLHTLLGDEHLQSYCANANREDDEEDLANRILNLREELRTVEFGLRRIRLDGMYKLKLRADEEAARGRDALAEMAERVGRQIVKARRRLEHLS